MRNRKSIHVLVKLFVFLSLSSAIVSCEKTPKEPKEVEFSFTTPDTLTFANSGNMPLNVNVSCAEDKSFGAKLSALNAAFYVNPTEIEIGSNESNKFDISFNHDYTEPGYYSCLLTVSMYNENNTPQHKEIVLEYKPSCAYNYKNHKNGTFIYVSNGNLLNKVISCNYNMSGQLAVSNLTPYPIVLDIDCASNSVTMIPIIHLGNSMTATGSLVNNEIELSIYADGILHATARIKP